MLWILRTVARVEYEVAVVAESIEVVEIRVLPRFLAAKVGEEFTGDLARDALFWFCHYLLNSITFSISTTRGATDTLRARKPFSALKPSGNIEAASKIAATTSTSG